MVLPVGDGFAMSPTTALRRLPPPDPPISVHSESSCLQSFPAFLKYVNARTFNVQTLSGLSPFLSSTSKLLAATHVHHRNALNSFSFIALRTTFFPTAGCVPFFPSLPTRLPRASRGRSPLASPVTSLECAVPRFRLLSPLECAVAKTRPRNSFRMRSYEKKGRGGTSPLPGAKTTASGAPNHPPRRLLPGLRVDLIVEGKIAV